MNNKKQIILIFFSGLITALLLLEIGLRLVGSIFGNNIVYDTSYLINKKIKPYTILCLGNSFTVGCGAPKDQSYPKQLQRLIDKEAKIKNVQVINAGLSNQNTTELLSSLNYNIVKWNPDLIILQTGQPNFCNQYKYRVYLERERSPGTFSRRFILYLNDLLYQSRVYRLILLLAYDIKEKPASVPEAPKIDDPKYLEIVEWFQNFRARLKWDPLEPQKAEKIIGHLKKKITLRPREANYYRCIGEIYLSQRKYKESAEWFIKGIKADPNYRRDSENKNYSLLRWVYQNSGDEEVSKLIDRFMYEFKKSNPEHSWDLVSLEEQEIYKWIESDLKEIIRIIQSKKIKIILQNYPPLLLGKNEIDYLNKFLLPKIAQDFNIPFVDNDKVFQGILDSGVKREVYFANDGHCNAKGYRVMAVNILNQIKEKRLIESDK